MLLVYAVFTKTLVRSQREDPTRSRSKQGSKAGASRTLPPFQDEPKKGDDSLRPGQGAHLPAVTDESQPHVAAQKQQAVDRTNELGKLLAVEGAPFFPIQRIEEGRCAKTGGFVRMSKRKTQTIFGGEPSRRNPEGTVQHHQ